MEKLLKDKERELTRMIKEAKEQTRNAQLHRMEGQRTRGTGGAIWSELNSTPTRSKSGVRKLAKRYSEKIYGHRSNRWRMDI